MIDHLATALFILAATGLLGSPGPAIAALLAVGKTDGFVGSLKFFTGLQLGLGLASAVSAGGLVAVLLAYPSIFNVLTIVATAYLLYLAWKIASSPLGSVSGDGSRAVAASLPTGFFLGVTNPKGYIAFASLIASQPLLPMSKTGDAFFKWLLIVVVMIVVDFLWLGIGVALGRAKLSPHGERLMNIALAAMVVVAAILPFLEAR